MLQWSLSLAIVLGFLAVGLGGNYWFSSSTSDTIEDVRLTRSQYQTLEQQLNLLQSPGITPLLNTLQEDMDALQIRLVEVMTQQPLPTGVVQVEYEQSVLPHKLEEGNGESISVLRLTLDLAVLHAMGLLEMFDRIDRSIGMWPYETRACELHRLTQQGLSAQCVVDFYHWSDSAERDAAQLPPVLFESPFGSVA
ncbi:hypothetical protein [Granulosicoccus antarcticus]|uniref:Uncharacterized protein n=1 Tax=Granulosicoccus antarcticus IMCC3135 TaxID=1192854 RepID=A0A2Z2P1W6_9GAMM|nr:hypothetical protein [Granulosicoccus antarcticus]ASJ76238.1 hypothetical protein IMCC3135_30945 [Granulosicoccus antarcticus IMCC3135]